MDQRAIQQFDEAASTYHASSLPQKEIATRLMAAIEHAQPCEPESVCEIGCGTGNLTELLFRRWPESRFVITDASESMWSRIDVPVGTRVQFQEFIASHQPLPSDVELAVANMVLQWTDDIVRVAATLAERCQTLAFSVPVAGTFAGWMAAHKQSGLEHGVREFPSEMRLKEQLHLLPVSVERFGVEDMAFQYANPIEFVRSLRLTGTSTPRDGHRPVNLRRIASQFSNGFTANYRIAFVVLKSTQPSGR